LYKSEYKKEFIKVITDEIKNAGRTKEAYIYFNNTWGTGAIANARQMQEILE
jgi:uncharacterized protein YecE (DUF72 family)